MRLRCLACVAACFALLAAGSAMAAVKLPAVIGDNMVLQRGQEVPIWGWADKGEEVAVTMAGQTVKAKADDSGKWMVRLAKLEAGGPHEMTIQSAGGNTTLKNILVGEVWVCSGQSNMEMGVAACLNAKEEIEAADYPKIRLLTVGRCKSDKPVSDIAGSWDECSPKTIKKGLWAGFSASAYYFGRTLHKELGVPVGLIHTSWGGTAAELWTSRKVLESNDALKPLAAGESSCLYNGMLAPLMPYGIRGAIWYQGESNVGRAMQYRTLFPAMIANWRADWGQGEFPFCYVQIAPYKYNNPVACAELWEAQALTLKSSPNTGMAVTTDITELTDIHPKNKQDVGKRLALWALAKTYGRDVVCSGPLYKSSAVDGGQIRIKFDYGVDMKASNAKPLDYFTIAGADKKFVPAEARVDGDSIVVSSKEVAEPVAVRFAWREDATPNLVNGAGLPASPFRSDEWSDAK